MVKKIRTRIALSYSMVIILVVVSLAMVFNKMVRDIYLETVRTEMAERARFIDLSFGLNSLPGGIRKSGVRDLAEKVKQVESIINMRVTIIDDNGVVIADSTVNDTSHMDNHRYRKEIKRAFETGSGEAIRRSNTLGTDMFYYAYRSGDHVVRLAKPLYRIEEGNRVVRNILLALSCLLGAGGIVITLLISRRVTGPIMETIRFADVFSRGDLSHRILNYRDDEIGMLQKSLNTMADSMVEKIDDLQKERTKLEVTLENIHDGIAVIDRGRRVVLFNGAFLLLTGNRVSIEGRPVFEVVRGSSFNAMVEYAMERGEGGRFEEEFQHGIICEVTITTLVEEKVLQGILVVLHDITEKKRIDRLKTELVGNLSHELKTPVAILKGYLETISEHLDEVPLCREMLRKSLINVDRQNAIISDMLKLNRIETTGEFFLEEINLGETVSGCADLLSQKALDKGVRIELFLDPPDMTVKANRFLVEEVFFNLMDNAISYNNPGGNVTVRSHSAGKGYQVSVEDSGIGIPAESLGRIYERFYRVDKGRSRETGGTGLGLAIVKHALEVLGWGISVTSGKNGSTFTVTIP